MLRIGALLLLAATPAFAGDVGGHHDAGLETLIYPTINFVIYAIGLVLIYRKLGAPALLKRHQLVKSELDRAAIELSQAERELESISKRLEGVDLERTSMLSRYEGEGRQMSETIIRNAKIAAERAVSDAARQIENEISQAQKSLQRESVLLAMKLARQKVQSELMPEEDKRLRKRVVDGVGSGAQ